MRELARNGAPAWGGDSVNWGVGDSRATLLVGRNRTRVSVAVVSDPTSANTVWISPSPADRGVPLGPGGGLTLSTTGEIYFRPDGTGAGRLSAIYEYGTEC